MKGSLILVESKNITTAFYVLNELSENTNLDVVMSKPLCPGRYMLILKGSLGEVKEAKGIIGRIKEEPSHIHTSTRVIGYIEDYIIDSINRPLNYPTHLRGLAILEVNNSIDAIKSADKIYKNGDIIILSIKVGLGLGAKGIIVAEGREADLQNGLRIIDKELGSRLISSQIISPPDKRFLENFKL